MTSIISQLSNIIAKSASTLEKTCETNGTALPDLNLPFAPQSEAFRSDGAAAEAAENIIAAALQLVALLQPPPNYVGSICNGSLVSAAMRACLETNTVEILRDAGPEGLHVSEIAEKSKLDSKKLVRLLRILATYHVFREVEPDVFANNRNSSILDTGKSVKELMDKPEDRHVGTNGYTALLEFLMDEAGKSAAYIPETLQHPVTGPSEEPNHAPLNRAFKCDVPYWDWIEQPGNEHRLKRFGLAMRGLATSQSSDYLLKGFKWDSLTSDDVIVDVGGGIGSSSMIIARAVPDVKFIVQDRPAVVDQGRELWKAQLPDAIDTGRVKFQAHNFFTPQPVQNASVFLINKILHDWSDPYAIKILTHLRLAASPTTKLLVVDPSIPHVCYDPFTQGSDAIPGAARRESEPPLLANLGAVNVMPYLEDLIMMSINNSQERTLDHLTGLLLQTGWKVVRVYRPDTASWLQQTEAVPI